MAISWRMKQCLDDARIAYEIIPHRRAYTAQEVAEAAHIPGDDVAKVVMTRVGNEFVMAVLPATRKLDRVALQNEIGADMRPRLLDEEEFGRLFPDCELGAEPPFGNLYNMKVVVDDSLTREDRIAFNAGNHTETIQMRYADYERLVQPRVASIAAP